jgi:hypothetical protein
MVVTAADPVKLPHLDQAAAAVVHPPLALLGLVARQGQVVTGLHQVSLVLP